MNAQITESEKMNAKEQKAQHLLSEREREIEGSLIIDSS